jgi:hypothetical protein
MREQPLDPAPDYASLHPGYSGSARASSATTSEFSSAAVP